MVPTGRFRRSQSKGPSRAVATVHLQRGEAAGRQARGAGHEAQEAALVGGVQASEDAQEVAHRFALAAVPVIELDRRAQRLHCPLLTCVKSSTGTAPGPAPEVSRQHAHSARVVKQQRAWIPPAAVLQL